MGRNRNFSEKNRKCSSHLLLPLLPRPTQPTGWLTSGGTRPSRSSTSPQTTGAHLPPLSTQSMTPNGNHSGNLSYDEFRYTFGGFAATDAGVIMALFDGDSD